MIESTIQGVLLGLLLSVFIGPVFFFLIETSINSGFRAALFVNIGVFSSDILCITLAYFCTAGLISIDSGSRIMKILGGIIFLIFGLMHLIKTRRAEEKPFAGQQSDYFRLFINGFALNALNPSVLIFWLGAVVLAVSQFGPVKIRMLFYFASALLTALSVDLLKIYSAGKLKKYITPATRQKMNRITGLVLSGFGLIVIFKTIL